MKTLDQTIVKLDQVDSLMYLMEGCIIEATATGSPEGKRLSDLFYVLLELLEHIEKDIRELNGHMTVCNAIYAVNRVDELKAELAALKGE